MAGTPWQFTVSPDTINEVTVTNGATTVVLQKTAGVKEDYIFYTGDFVETTYVTISATGYNDATNILVGTSSVTLTPSSTKPQFLYAYTDPDTLSTTIYAWTSANAAETIYTRTLNIELSSILVDNTNTPLENYVIKSIVSDTVIDVEHNPHVEQIQYYGFNYIGELTINAASGYSGTFTRDNTKDGTITYITAAGREVSTYGFGWVQDSQVIYTLLSSPRPETDYWIVNGESLNNTGKVATASSEENVLLNTENFDEATTVYNTEFEGIGIVDEVLNTVVMGGVQYTGFLYNNKKYYRNTTSDTTHPELVTEIDSYTRDSASDVIIPPSSTAVSTYYTDTTTLTSGLTLYDNSGTLVDEVVGTVVSADSFNVDHLRYYSIDGTTFNFNTTYLPTLFAIGKNWVNVTKQNSNVLYHIDLSSSTPTITQNSYGDIKLTNGYLSDSTSLCVGSWNSSTHTGYKLLVNNTTGSLTTSLSSVIESGNVLLGVTETAIVIEYNQRTTQSPAAYTSHIYWNDAHPYSLPESSRLLGTYMQTGPETITGVKSINSYGIELTSSSYTQLSNALQNWGTLDKCGFLQTSTEIFNSAMAVVVSSLGGNYLYKRSISDVITPSASYFAGEDHYIWIIGAINGYLYCIDISGWDTTAKGWTASSVVKLKLLRETDFSLAYEEVLPNDPFNEYSGVPTFWDNARCKAYNSKTGYVGVASYNVNTNKYNIARISQIL